MDVISFFFNAVAEAQTRSPLQYTPQLGASAAQLATRPEFRAALNALSREHLRVLADTFTSLPGSTQSVSSREGLAVESSLQALLSILLAWAEDEDTGTRRERMEFMGSVLQRAAALYRAEPLVEALSAIQLLEDETQPPDAIRPSASPITATLSLQVPHGNEGDPIPRHRLGLTCRQTLLQCLQRWTRHR